MKKALATIGFVVLSLAGCVGVAYRSGLSTSQLYTTADILNVRAQPDSKSPIVAKLPYGTAVSGRRTSRFETIGGRAGYWVNLVDIGGYAFEQYLQTDVLIPKRKHMKIDRHSQWADCESDMISREHDSIVMHDGVAELTRNEHAGFWESRRLDYIGTYSFRGKVLELKFGTGKRVVVRHNAPELDSTAGSSEAAGLQYALLWDGAIEGFSLEGDYQMREMKSKWGLNKRLCFFSLPPNHKVGSLKEMCDLQPRPQQASIIGYFCLR